MDPIKESSTIVYSTIIFSVGLYPVRGIVVCKENRFVKRRVVYKVGSL
jgi:hypothetical protein